MRANDDNWQGGLIAYLCLYVSKFLRTLVLSLTLAFHAAWPPVLRSNAGWAQFDQELTVHKLLQKLRAGDGGQGLLYNISNGANFKAYERMLGIAPLRSFIWVQSPHKYHILIG